MTATPLLACFGHLCCSFCSNRYDHAIVEGADLTPRQQLRQAAARVGWKQTSADLDACPECAAGVAALLIEGWLLFWSPRKALQVDEDTTQTATIPAVVEHDAA